MRLPAERTASARRPRSNAIATNFQLWEAKSKIGPTNSFVNGAKLKAMAVTKPAFEVMTLAPQILAGQVRGRIVLELS